jgi:hypothetical protein
MSRAVQNDHCNEPRAPREHAERKACRSVRLPTHHLCAEPACVCVLTARPCCNLNAYAAQLKCARARTESRHDSWQLAKLAPMWMELQEHLLSLPCAMHCCTCLMRFESRPRSASQSIASHMCSSQPMDRVLLRLVHCNAGHALPCSNQAHSVHERPNMATPQLPASLELA